MTGLRVAAVRRRVRTGFAAGLSVVVLAGLVSALPPYAAALADPATPPVGRSVAVSPVRPSSAPSAELERWRPLAVLWPTAASAVVDLPLHASGLRSGGSVRVGGLPVAVSAALPPGDVLLQRELARAAAAAPARVRVEVVPEAVSQGRQVPFLLRLSRADGVGSPGRVSVSLDYSGFRGAFGADWSQRLRLAAWPGCARAAAAGCTDKVLSTSRNDAESSTVSAEMSVSEDGTLVTLATTSSSGGGDFARSDIKGSQSWAAGRSSGDFTWSYPLSLPPVPGGLAPKVTLSYSSGAVDGQTAAENTQPGDFGEGWSYTPGFIERTYRTCSDDGANSPYWPSLSSEQDLCWRLPNASITLNGKSSQIILGSDNKWRLEDDDGEKVELLKGGGNRDDDHEYWKITTTDGTQYWFGLQTLSGGRNTYSVASVPMFANHSGEPCFSDVSAWSSRCRQAYRWMLDRVVDTHGNEMVFYYSTENNMTTLNGTTTVWNYERAVHLERIEYGLRESDQGAVPAPARVVFTNSDRCIGSYATCHWSGGSPKMEAWPDTPWDLNCTASPCSNNIAPSFWSSKRVSKIETQVRMSGVYEGVDEWALEQLFPSTGNSTSPVLWLDKIYHTGNVGAGSVALPMVKFGGTLRNNQADRDPASTAMPKKYRVKSVATEHGGLIEVAYSATDSGCQWGGAFPNPDFNYSLCFPQYVGGWTWWHKYVVTSVTETDLVGGSPAVLHGYTYSNAATAGNSVLWSYATGSAVWASSTPNRSWSNWRGYTNVTMRTGLAASGVKSRTDYIYLRGLHGDRTDTGTRNVTITDFTGQGFTDRTSWAGHLLQTQVYDRDGGTPVQMTRSDPWESVTGTRTLATAWAVPNVFTSALTRTAKEIRWEWVSGGWSTRQVTFSTWHTTNGRLVSVSDEGLPTPTDDDRCTRYTYADNPATNMLGYVSQTQTAKGTCSTTPTMPGDRLSESRYFYDNQAAHGTAPTVGDVTKTEAFGPDGWITANQTGVDPWGRPTSVADALGRTTQIAYTNNADGLMSMVQVSNPLGHTASTTLDVNRGLPLTVTDANDKTTTGVYDALGRLVSVTRPGNTSGTPDVEYTYSVTKTAPTSVRTQQLGPDGQQIGTYEIFDGLMRPRQTQTTAPDSKRTITDTQYDTKGLAAKTSMFYNNASGPTSTLEAFSDTNVEVQHRYTYDGRGRMLTDQLWSLGVEKQRTSIARQWDRITITPPAGSTVTTDVYDDRGQLREKRLMHTTDPNGTFDADFYTYNLRGELTGATDPAGNQWTYRYDVLGRQDQSVDPDAGTTTTVYDNAGQVTSRTDGRGQQLFYTYDNLGRATELREDSPTGSVLASWSYDSIAKGQPTSSTRHDGGLAYVSAVTGYDHGYQPTGTTVTIPASTENGELAGTYTTTMTYKINGAAATLGLPSAGGLPAETLTYAYTSAGLPDSTTSPLATYLASASYLYDGSLAEERYGAAGTQVRRQLTYAPDTRRLGTATVDLESQTTPGTFTQAYATTYGYDQAGNVTSMAGATNGVTDRVECFTYDQLRRLKQAWTQTATSCTTPQRSGPDPYWRSWDFDTIGNRTQQIDHNPTGDTTWTYHNGAAYSVSPHQVATVAATGPAAGTPNRLFAYDDAGHTIGATTTSGASQILTWDAEGRLASLTVGTDTTTSYLYDAGGNRMIGRTPAATTLYLGHTEIKQALGSGTISATRYYGNAVRDTAGLTWTIADHHGTGTIQANAATLSTQRRRSLPYGEELGTAPTSWIGTKGFVGGTTDDTGLTHLGAREYDPTLGRFISVDPLMDLLDPQQWHGYSYANNNPTTSSDPSGLLNADPTSLGNCSWYCEAVNLANMPEPDMSLSGFVEAVPPVLGAFYDAFGTTVVAGGKEILGINDAVDCAHGRSAACAWFAVGLLTAGIGKAAKLLKWAAAAGALDEVLDIANALRKSSAGGRHADDGLGLADDGLAHADNGARLTDNASEVGSKIDDCLRSFSASTHVLLADGSTKPISEIEVGDEVTTTDPETGETAPKKVTQVWVHDDLLVDLSLEDAGTVTTTEDHPFWNATDQQWQEAQELTRGDLVLTTNGETRRVAGFQWDAIKIGAAYNLTVDGIHAYYVLAGDTPVLVHNAGGEPGPGQIYLWRAVLQPELDSIYATRAFSNPAGIETKYFSYTEQGAAEFASRMYSRFPGEGPYTIIRTTINVADIPAGSVLPHVADVVDGGVALPTESLSNLGRPRIMPSASSGIGC